SARRRQRRRARHRRSARPDRRHQRRRRARRRHGAHRSDLKETTMPSMRDKKGRPVVVVTGAGVVTSLGAGKNENWTKLLAGQYGIPAITRFPPDHLKTRIGGTVDFLPVEPMSSPGLCE